MKRLTGIRRLLERELISGIGARRRRALIERLRGNADQRRGWDRAIAAFRVLEQREVSRFEVDQVERWLFEDLGDLGVVAPARPRWRWAWLGGVAATIASAAAVLLWIDGDRTGELNGELPAVSDGSDELVARGEDSFARPRALELVCGQPVRAAATHGCTLDETLGFSIRLGSENLTPEAASALARAPLHVSAFGLAEDGSVFYYLPTPDEAASTQVSLGAPWQPLPFSVRLAVNHAPGRVRVFALASDRPAKVADIDRLAAALASQGAANLDDPPWHLRLPDPLLASLCPNSSRCASAETVLSVSPAHPDPAHSEDQP
jgi:hypothetical protein